MARAVLAYVVGVAIVATGVFIGTRHLDRQEHSFYSGRKTVAGAFASWDGAWYIRIASEGYSYGGDSAPTVVFFPLYPLLGACTARALGVDTEWGVLLVSHACLLAATCLFARYVALKEGHETRSALLALMAFTLWPTSMFFRMAYTEAAFLVLALMAMYGMEKRWPPWTVAAIVGAATATRSVAVGLVPIVACWAWRRSDVGRRALVFMTTGVLSSWGLLAFMIYQYVAYGDAIAFIKAQESWRTRPTPPLGEHALALASLEPAWSVYVPGALSYWRVKELVGCPVLSMQFMNPIYLGATVGLVWVGGVRRWINAREVALSVMLIAIPFVTHAHQGAMLSQARYAAVVFPVYIVLGRLGSRMSRFTVAAAASVAAVLLCTYAAMFAAWYRIF